MTIRNTWHLAVSLLTGLSVLMPFNGCAASNTVTDSASGQLVYFLGVDTAPVDAQMAGISQTMFGKDDRWGFTDFAQQALQENDTAQVSHDLRNWRPLDDPFNVAVIILRALNVSSKSFGDIGYREYATAELVWIHIGQDRLGMGMTQTFPEVRATITQHHTAYGESSEPFSEADKQALQVSAIQQGIEQLIQHVSTYQARTTVRRATEIRYVTVVPAPLQRRARSGIAAIYGDREDPLARLISARVVQLTESIVMDAIYSSGELDRVIILPAGNTLDIMTKLWPDYARRIFAQSSNSGARRVLGERPPRIRTVGRICEPGNDPRIIEVPGWHIRSILASIEATTSPLSDYASRHRVTITTAAALRIPMDSSTYVHGDVAQTTAIGQSAPGILDEPNEIGLDEALNEDVLSKLIRQAISKALPTMLEQLGQLQKQPENMSEYRNQCDEKV